MSTTWRSLFLVVSLPLVLGVACDPMAPGATGQLIVSPEAKFEAGRTLEIRLLADDGKPFDVATADLVVEYRHRQASWNLAEIEFPFQYDIGGGLGSSEHEHWRVIAWIAESEEVDRPKPGEWYGTRELSVEDCGAMISGYCGVMFGVDLAIEFIRADVSSRRVESELQPGEYIEESFGNYTMRCKEGGEDDARSIGTFVVTIYAGGSSLTDSTTDRLITETVVARDGMIQDCWMTDLDGDGNGEVVLFSKSAGSGGYANLHVYKFDGTDLQPIELPAPDPELMSGFQGRDWYEIEDGMLIRKFPLYLEGDANCCPEGGSRTIEFDSTTSTWEQSSS